MVEHLYKRQERPGEIRVLLHGEQSGSTRQKTRRSTTAGAIMHGSCLIAHWSCSHVSLALSSAEEELNASVKPFCEHLVRPVVIQLFGDSSAMKGALSRKAFAKTK